MRRGLAGPLLALALAAASCGSPATEDADAGPAAAEIPVPETLAGLAVVPEPDATKKIAETARVRDTYTRDGVVYGLRRGEELMAVLEIVRLTADARPDERDFRTEVVGQIGGRVPAPERMGDLLVYGVMGNQQEIFVWFFGRYMSVLIVRADKAAQGKVDAREILAEAVTVRP